MIERVENPERVYLEERTREAEDWTEDEVKHFFKFYKERPKQFKWIAQQLTEWADDVQKKIAKPLAAAAAAAAATDSTEDNTGKGLLSKQHLRNLEVNPVRRFPKPKTTYQCVQYYFMHKYDKEFQEVINELKVMHKGQHGNTRFMKERRHRQEVAKTKARLSRKRKEETDEKLEEIFNEYSDDEEGIQMIQPPQPLEIPKVEQILGKRQFTQQSWNREQEMSFYQENENIPFDEEDGEVKYKKLSYLHVTWVNPDDVPNEMLEKFEEDHPEAIEEFRGKSKLDLVNDNFVTIDRIIAEEREDIHMVLIKWKGLRYNHCTYEYMDIISRKPEFDDCYETYKLRLEPPPKKKTRHVRLNKVKLKGGTFQPEENCDSLVDFPNPHHLFDQQTKEDVNTMNAIIQNFLTRTNCILNPNKDVPNFHAKIAAALISYFGTYQKRRGPCMLVVRPEDLSTWKYLLEYYLPSKNIIEFTGNRLSITQLRQYEFYYYDEDDMPLTRECGTKFDILITSPGILLAYRRVLAEISWTYAFIQGVEDLLSVQAKIRDSVRYIKLRHMMVMLEEDNLTLKSYYGWLNVVEPKNFKTSRDFSSRYNSVDELDPPYVLRHGECVPQHVQDLQNKMVDEDESDESDENSQHSDKRRTKRRKYKQRKTKKDI
eukprot:CAMPEP_0117433406 /NCGR_PEP_ID=MMETSP0758-20121206/12779_1 /TAXON_ID=63605 /ORGANISM="Percolomonas cosmopolitus, Strain AE-1 (ATCC 50343)" /LENGTH=655 /DNA_ID=CAMNT_0005224061 /DNA_START=322 /DNA_END=2287 /DNA_ORIENTATION=+